jgi:glycosyltransferase involved in cell wall biosynthesis
MQSLRILISHTSVFKKAGWGRIFPLAVGLAKNGNNVTIITTSEKFTLFTKRIILNNVNIIIYPEIIPSRISRMGFGILSLLLKIFHVLSNKYDVVHSDNGHRPLSGIPCRIHKKFFGSVYAAEWYDWYGKGGQYDSKKKIFKLLLGSYELKYEIKDKMIADGIIVLSEILRNRAEMFKPKERVIKIHGGADVSSIPFLYDNSSLKLKYNIDIDTLTFGYINSNSYKLAEFFPIINAINKIPHHSKIKILLFGECELLIKQLPPDALNIVIPYGWIDFTNDYEKLQLVDIFFLFKEEIMGNKAGWPNCLGDYLACGRPILLHPVGEVVDFVKEHPFAFFECTRDESNIYSKIKYILGNLVKIRELGPAIRELAEKRISWQSKSNDLLDFYLYLLKNRNSY